MKTIIRCEKVNAFELDGRKEIVGKHELVQMQIENDIWNWQFNKDDLLIQIDETTYRVSAHELFSALSGFYVASVDDERIRAKK